MLHRTSMAPNVWRAVSTTFAIECSSSKSAGHSRRRSPVSPKASRRAPMSRPINTTLARASWNAVATACPRLPAAPVTSTVLPAKFIASMRIVEQVRRRELVGEHARAGGPAVLDFDLRQQPCFIDAERRELRYQQVCVAIDFHFVGQTAEAHDDHAVVLLQSEEIAENAVIRRAFVVVELAR